MVHIDEADPEAVAVDDLGSDAELDEDAVPMRKVVINNKVRHLEPAIGDPVNQQQGLELLTWQPALRQLRDAIRVTSAPWPEHLTLTSKEVIDVDHDDGMCHFYCHIASIPLQLVVHS
jgi:rRNA-processing protein EBP2